MKKKPVGRRGRKPGDGVLKEIEPQGPALQTAQKLALGRTAGDPIAEMVRTWQGIKRRYAALAEWEKKLGQERIAAAESVQASDAKPQSGRFPIKILYAEPDPVLVQASDEKPQSGKPDIAAIHYWEEKRFLGDWLSDMTSKLNESAYWAILSSNADWFRKVAEAIEAEGEADDQDTFPLHSAVLRLFGQLRHTINKDGVRCYSTDAPLDTTPRYTIDAACKQLEQGGFRPDGQGDAEWQRIVRRAFDQVGLKLKTSKPGPKKS